MYCCFHLQDGLPSRSNLIDFMSCLFFFFVISFSPTHKRTRRRRNLYQRTRIKDQGGVLHLIGSICFVLFHRMHFFSLAALLRIYLPALLLLHLVPPSNLGPEGYSAPQQPMSIYLNKSWLEDEHISCPPIQDCSPFKGKLSWIRRSRKGELNF